MDKLRALKYFIEVAETANFSQAARKFNVPASSVSRRIADLERELGATLLQRSTRIVKLTEIGRDYYQQISPLVQQLEQCDEQVSSYQTHPSGKLAISAMPGFGEQILLPRLEAFSESYPEVTLDVNFTNQVCDLVRDDVDIAIRGGQAPDDRVVAVRLHDNQFIAAASPTYLERYGLPQTPECLANHRGLYFRTPTGRLDWYYQHQEQWQKVTLPIQLVSNNGYWLIRRAIAGEGIVMLPQWALQHSLDHKKLIKLDISPAVRISNMPDPGIFLLYQKQRYTVPKVKYMVDFLMEAFHVTHA